MITDIRTDSGTVFDVFGRADTSGGTTAKDAGTWQGPVIRAERTTPGVEGKHAVAFVDEVRGQRRRGPWHLHTPQRNPTLWSDRHRGSAIAVVGTESVDGDT